MEGQKNTSFTVKNRICDGCGNGCTVKEVHVLTGRGYREIHLCESCFDFAKENGMMKNAYSR